MASSLLKPNLQEIHCKIAFTTKNRMTTLTPITTKTKERTDAKTFFINDGVTSKICPYCKKRYGYSGTKMEFSDIKIDKDDYIIGSFIVRYTLLS